MMKEKEERERKRKEEEEKKGEKKEEKKGTFSTFQNHIKTERMRVRECV
jgi:hypothetical protein